MTKINKTELTGLTKEKKALLEKLKGKSPFPVDLNRVLDMVRDDSRDECKNEEY